jgi:hypothetical protein
LGNLSKVQESTFYTNRSRDKGWKAETKTGSTTHYGGVDFPGDSWYSCLGDLKIDLRTFVSTPPPLVPVLQELTEISDPIIANGDGDNGDLMRMSCSIGLGTYVNKTGVEK